MNPKGWSFVVLVVMFVVMVVAGCTARVEPSVQQSTATVAVPTSVPTAVPTATVEPSATPEPTATVTPEPTFTPTQAATATPTRGSRVWVENEVGAFISFVASWFLDPISYPPLPREGDSIARLLDQFEYHKDTISWTGPAEQVDPDAACEWAFRRLVEGYSLTLIDNGKIVNQGTREQRWVMFSMAVGDKNREPYCPQFDKELGVPDFGT